MSNMTVITLDLEDSISLNEKEAITVFYKEIRQIEGLRNENNIGSIEGHIDVIYPSASGNITLTLGIYTEINEHGDLDGCFIFPFTDIRKSLYQIICAQREALVYEALELAQVEEFEEKCTCGGTMRPEYDAHPNWIKYCRGCGRRTSDHNCSPIVEC